MNKTKIINSAILAAYSAFLLIVVLNHEYWFDEAQAWNIARDNDLAGIVAMMKYEGHPPLWHFILKIFTSLGCSYAALGLVSWGISTLAAAVTVFALPVKPYLKAALLLSSGMLYINSAISRVYCLINLLLVLIAWIYPYRKRSPLLFGVLIALLANTHICMCGLVGIIGIYMLIDYFRDFKNNSAKQNILNTSGLAAAGIGVAVLILPLLGSLGANSVAAEQEFSVSRVIKGFAGALSENILCAYSNNFPDIVGVLLSAAGQALFFAVLFFLWTNRRAFISVLIFTAFYLIIDGVIWYATPNRGAVFIFAAAAIPVMFREGQPISFRDKQSKNHSVYFEKIKAVLTRSERAVPVICSCFLALSIPSGVKYAVDDLTGEFAPHKSAAEFIQANIPKDALLVSYEDDHVVLPAYLPDKEIYSIQYSRFYTYCSHEVIKKPFDRDNFLEFCADYSEIYYVSGVMIGQTDMQIVYENTNCIPFVLIGDGTVIYKTSAEQILEILPNTIN